MSLAIASEREPRRLPHKAQPTRPERHLTVVPPVTRRTVSYVVVVIVAILTMMAVVIGFQAFIAEQQLRLDKVSSDLRLARLNYDELRQQRADLLAPDYLREKARLMGMSQGLGSRFMDVPESVVAEVVASTGTMDPVFAEPLNATQIHLGGLINSFQVLGNQP